MRYGANASRLAAAVAACGLLAAPACGPRESRSPRTYERLRAIGSAYLDFAAATGVGPVDERRLKDHLGGSLAFDAAKQKTGDVEIAQMFASDRDNQPFVIVYGLPLSVAADSSAPAIALERNGRDGERYVALANGNVIRVGLGVHQDLIDGM